MRILVLTFAIFITSCSCGNRGEVKTVSVGQEKIDELNIPVIEKDSQKTTTKNVLFSSDSLAHLKLLDINEFKKIVRLNKAGQFEDEKFALVYQNNNYAIGLYYAQGSDNEVYYLISITNGEFSIIDAYENSTPIAINVSLFWGEPESWETEFKRKYFIVYDDKTISVETTLFSESEKLDTTYTEQYNINEEGLFYKK